MRISDWSSDVCSSDLRAHLRDAVKEKAFLLLDDFARYLDDRALALVERTHQPIGADKLFGQPRLALRRRAPCQFGINAAVDAAAEEGCAVALNTPALRIARHQHLGAHRPRPPPAPPHPPPR